MICRPVAELSPQEAAVEPEIHATSNAKRPEERGHHGSCHTRRLERIHVHWLSLNASRCKEDASKGSEKYTYFRSAPSAFHSSKPKPRGRKARISR